MHANWIVIVQIIDQAFIVYMLNVLLKKTLPCSMLALTGKEIILMCFWWIDNAHSALGITSRSEFHFNLSSFNGHTLIDEVNSTVVWIL